MTTEHLTDGELFALAAPPTGAPEPLPGHLSECLRCSRALAEWKSAVRDLADEDAEAISSRTPEEWRVAEDATMAAIRRAGAPGRGRSRTMLWTLPAAASLLLFALLVGERGERSAPDATSARLGAATSARLAAATSARLAAATAFEDPAGLSNEDREDDALLRDVERLASGEETAPGELAPEPDGDPSAAGDERS